MRNKYKIEIWRHHSIYNEKEFTNKKVAKKWIKSKGYDTMSNYGECYIQVIVNGKALNVDEKTELGWI